MTLTTVDADGVPASRTLIVKDIDADGIHFSSSRTTRKAAQLAINPIATMLFFWRPLGRQLEVTGPVSPMSAELSAADWRERPNYEGIENPNWQVWALSPQRVEFMQARADRRHTRVEYVLEDGNDGQLWRHDVLVPSESLSVS